MRRRRRKKEGVGERNRGMGGEREREHCLLPRDQRREGSALGLPKAMLKQLPSEHLL